MSPYEKTPYYPAPGEVVDGKYQIEKLLGQGGMGAVAKATHLLLRAPVALKFMNPEYIRFAGAVDRFLNEGIASRAIRSEHVVQVDDVGKLPSGAPYLVMDCLEGVDLSELLKKQGHPGLGVERSVHIVLQILRGLLAAHAAGIVHRDMKPSNCFVIHHEGEDDFVKILDFGISKVAQQEGSASLTKTNTALGTPLYMSPEQAKSPKDVDFRSDIYSVGVILYEMLSGKTPFTSASGEFTEILFKLFTAEIPPIRAAVPEVSEGLAKVVHKALAREVEDRYQTVQELAEELIPFAGPSSIALVKKIAAWKPESVSIVPGAHVPPSMVAFAALHARESRLPTQALGQAAHVVAEADLYEKTLEVGEEHLVLRPSDFPVVRVSDPPAKAPSNAPGRMTADEHVRHSDVSPLALRSQEIANPMAAAVRTNLTSERDAIPPPPSLRGRKRSPFLYVIPAIGLAVLAAAAVTVVKSQLGSPTSAGQPPPTTSAIATTQATSTGVKPATSAAATAIALTVTTTAPSASASPSARPSQTAALSQSAPPQGVVTPPPPTRPSLHNTTLQQ